MNKEKFIKTLKEKLNIDENKAKIINNILESNNIISKKGKENIINDLMGQLKIDLDEAKDIYEKTIDIIKNAIKNKLKHPFRKD